LDLVFVVPLLVFSPTTFFVFVYSVYRWNNPARAGQRWRFCYFIWIPTKAITGELLVNLLCSFLDINNVSTTYRLKCHEALLHISTLQLRAYRGTLRSYRFKSDPGYKAPWYLLSGCFFYSFNMYYVYILYSEKC